MSVGFERERRAPLCCIDYFVMYNKAGYDDDLQQEGHAGLIL